MDHSRLPLFLLPLLAIVLYRIYKHYNFYVLPGRWVVMT